MALIPSGLSITFTRKVLSASARGKQGPKASSRRGSARTCTVVTTCTKSVGFKHPNLSEVCFLALFLWL